MLSLPAPRDDERTADHEARIATLMEQFTNDEGLTIPLTDDAAGWLLHYAEQHIRQWVSAAMPQEELNTAVSTLRRQLRKAARIAGAEDDQLTALQALLEPGSDETEEYDEPTKER